MYDVAGNIYDIQRFSVHDGPGIRTTVYFKGCPLRCVWCHNPESQSFNTDLAFIKTKCIGILSCGVCLSACKLGAINKDNSEAFPTVARDKCNLCLECTNVCPGKALYSTLRRTTVKECIDIIRKDKRYYDDTAGGVTISGGEPMSQFEFCKSLAIACKSEGYNTALDTAGSAETKKYLEILPFIDLFLYDLKHMDSEGSKQLTGEGNEIIKENAVAIAKAGGRFWVRIPIIPKMNDYTENLKATAEFCAKIKASIDKVQLLPFHNMGQPKYQRIGKEYTMDTSEPSPFFLKEILELFRSYNLPAQVG